MADLMILVAGSAIGIAWTKLFHEGQFGTLALACSTMVLTTEVTTMVVGWILKLVLVRLTLGPRGNPIVYSNRLVTLTYQINTIGLVIAVCWLLLFVLDRRRAEKTWIDHLGEALGVGWIAMHILLGIVNYAHL